MAEPEASISGNQTADLDAAEREFVATMDAIQEYMQLQTKLQEQLKQGLLSLARAKYSMGAIGQAQYDMDMEASVRVAVRAGDDEAAKGDETSCSDRHRSRPSFALQRMPYASSKRQPQCAEAVGTASGPPAKAPAAVPDAAAAAAAPPRSEAVGRAAVEEAAVTAAAKVEEAGIEVEFSDDDEGGKAEGDEEEGLREANEFLRRMRMESEVESEAGCGDAPRGGGGGGGNETGRPGDALQQRQQRQERQQRRRGGGGGGGAGRRDPLLWFGLLVPPALKQAQGQFAAALDTALRLANTAQKVAPRRVAAAAAT